MTSKGLEVCKAIFPQFSNVISQVVVGRDLALENDFSEEIIKLCEAHGVDCVDRSEFSGPSEGDYIMAISWRWMINHSPEKLIIFHDSLLPKYRGFSPLVNMLINGEMELGATVLLGAKRYDRGEIIAQRSLPISYPLKIRDAIEIVGTLYSELALEVCSQIAEGNPLVTQRQDEQKASYSIWRDEEDYFIDWNDDSRVLKRTIDALGFPFKGARCFLDGQEEVIIKEAEIVDDLNLELRHVGKVLEVDDAGMPTVICGSGLLKVQRIESACDERKPLLPLAKFRTRFTSKAY